jgi:hypothetical protein
MRSTAPLRLLCIPLVAPTRHARVSRMETWVMAWHPLTMCHCYHPHTLDKNTTDRSARLIGQIDRASPVSPSVCLRMARRIHETVFAFLTKSDLISKRCAARIISRSIRTKVTPFFVTSHCSRKRRYAITKRVHTHMYGSRFHAPSQMGNSSPHFPHAFASRTHMPCQSRTHIPVTTQTKAQCIHMPQCTHTRLSSTKDSRQDGSTP